MARHLSVGTIIEKNRISSETPFLILMDADINDDQTGELVTRVSFVKNTENITFGGVEYSAANFDVEIQVDNASEPEITLTAQDQTRALAQYIEAYAGLVNSTITMTVVNAGRLDGPPEIQESFKITSTEVSEYVVTFNLGTDSAVNRRFPLYLQNKDRCTWKYKGPRCRYSGVLPTCDYSLEGTNGCTFHNNVNNYGGFPGMNLQDNSG